MVDISGDLEMGSDRSKAIWYPLAKAFREYITEIDNVLVFPVKCAGDDFQSAAIRTWEDDPDRDRIIELAPEWEREKVDAETSTHRIRDTILFKADLIICYNVREGHFEIELACPIAQEILLGWMKRCGLTKEDVELTGALAWKGR